MTNQLVTHDSLCQQVFVSRDKKTMWIILPPELCRPIDGGCFCDDCKDDPSLATWNALAISRCHSHSWTVHMSRSALRTGLQSGDITMARTSRRRG